MVKRAPLRRSRPPASPSASLPVLESLDRSGQSSRGDQRGDERARPAGCRPVRARRSSRAVARAASHSSRAAEQGHCGACVRAPSERSLPGRPVLPRERFPAAQLRGCDRSQHQLSRDFDDRKAAERRDEVGRLPRGRSMAGCAGWLARRTPAAPGRRARCRRRRGSRWRGLLSLPRFGRVRSRRGGCWCQRSARACSSSRPRRSPRHYEAVDLALNAPLQRLEPPELRAETPGEKLGHDRAHRAAAFGRTDAGVAVDVLRNRDRDVLHSLTDDTGALACFAPSTLKHDFGHARTPGHDAARSS